MNFNKNKLKKMGVNCCSHAKESPDITITKPEKNMISASQNTIIKNENKNEIPVEYSSINQQKELNKQFDVNNINIYEQNQNFALPLTEKEIDDILNNELKDIEYQPQQQNIITNINNINNINPIEQKMNQNQNNLIKNNALDIDELLKQQEKNNQKVSSVQNIPNNQKIINDKNIQLNNKNNQQIPGVVQNQNLNQNKIIKINQNNMQNIQNKNMEDYDKYFSSQKNNQNNNINEIINEQNNQQINNNTDKYIDELLKKSFSKPSVHTNSNINLDVFFNQNENVKIDDALIDQLFESAGKPIIQQSQQQINNKDPLYLSQRISPNQSEGNNNYFSPVNSPQRSEISEPGNTNYRLNYTFK